jgi:hypothetical protein
LATYVLKNISKFFTRCGFGCIPEISLFLKRKGREHFFKKAYKILQFLTHDQFKSICWKICKEDFKMRASQMSQSFTKKISGCTKTGKGLAA